MGEMDTFCGFSWSFNTYRSCSWGKVDFCLALTERTGAFSKDSSFMLGLPIGCVTKKLELKSSDYLSLASF